MPQECPEIISLGTLRYDSGEERVSTGTRDRGGVASREWVWDDLSKLGGISRFEEYYGGGMRYREERWETEWQL